MFHPRQMLANPENRGRWQNSSRLLPLSCMFGMTRLPRMMTLPQFLYFWIFSQDRTIHYLRPFIGQVGR